LGYYSRARTLHRAARYIAERCDGRFPETFEAIRALPGVGEYTAGAVASIAFNQPVPAVDANVRRLLARLGDLARPTDEPAAQSLIRETARALIPAESPRLFNQALMELGAVICLKKPRCGMCPVARHCAAQQRGTTAMRPLPKAKTQYHSLEMVAGILRHRKKILIRQRPPQGLWANLWEFPGGLIEPGETPPEAIARHILEQTGLTAAAPKEIAIVRHGYTTRRVTLHGYFCDIQDANEAPPTEGTWLPPEELAALPFPAGHRKLMEHLGWKKDRP
jgi:A/G-specific adenine glycosylase